MELLVEWVGKIIGLDVVQIIGAVIALVTALIGVCLLIPGEQPEKFLQKILDLLKKLSVK